MSKEFDNSPEQQEVLSFIVNYTSHHHYPPTMREINDARGIQSTSSPHRILNDLEVNELIQRPKSSRGIHRSRAIKVTLRPNPIVLEESVEDRVYTEPTIEEERARYYGRSDE